MTGNPFLVWLRGGLLALLLAFAATPARAVDIQSLFKDLCQYGVLDSDTCAAKTLVDCLVKTGGNMDALLKCAGDYDPKAKAFIDIYFAAKKPDYVKLIELAGPVVACQGASVVLPPGLPKDILCSELLAPLVKSSFSTAAQIYQAAVDQNWAKLIYLAGPGLGCEVIDKYVGGIPGQELLCGTVAKVIEEAVKIGKDAAKAGKAAGEFLWDTGSDIISGVGGALEGACEGIGLCDDGGKKLMSGSQYYTYRLFPLIHDRVLARLASGQQHLGHDSASLQACLKYYQYDLYANHPMFKQLAPKVKQGCETLGARLHKEADAMAVMFAAAPTPYFEASVKPLIAAWIVSGPGSGKDAQSVTQQCVNHMRAKLPIPEPSKPGTTAWDQVCKQVVSLFNTAYAAEKNKIAAAIKPLEAQGCKQKLSLTEFKVACASYEGFAACQAAYTPMLPCALIKNQADVALADALLKQLGSKRCKIVDEVKTLPCPNQGGTIGTCKVAEKHLLCARPWKVEQCAALLGKLAGKNVPSSSVKCKGDMAGLAAFAKLEGQASALINQLNGGGGVIGTKPGFGDAKAKASAGAGSCKPTWDPLAITCDQSEIAAHPEIALPACPPDPNKDGADLPCYAGFSSIKPLHQAKTGFFVPSGPLVLPEANNPAGPPTGGPIQALPALGLRQARPLSPERERPARVVAPSHGLAALAVPQADLALAQRIRIAGRSMAAGDVILLSAQELHHGRGGCEAIVETPVLNGGTTASGPFEVLWQVGGLGAASSIFTDIASGASQTQRAKLPLRPGINVLEVRIDASGRVAESNEANNQGRFVVNLSGDCGTGTRALPAPTATGTPPAGMLAPRAPTPGIAAPDLRRPPPARPHTAPTR